MDNIFRSMPRCTVTLSANAGVSLSLGGKKIWIDAVNEGKVNEFSGTTPEILRQMNQRNAFQFPDYILYTHCHPDHFSQELTRQAREGWPRSVLLLPEERFDNQVLVSGNDYKYEDKELSFHFLKVTHEGEEYRDYPHYVIVITYTDDDGERTSILVTGDAQVGSRELKEQLGTHGYLDGGIDLALVDFPWITLKKGRREIEDWLCPKHLFIYHVPFEEDDMTGFRKATEKSAAKLEGIGDVRILKEPMQAESIL